MTSPQTKAELLRMVRQTIRKLEETTQERPDDRLLQRVIAYLWMAQDELEQFAGAELAA